MKRSEAINAIRFAGYHGDKSTFTSLYIENRVSRVAAEQAFREGAAARKAGQRCGCIECKEDEERARRRLDAEDGERIEPGFRWGEGR